MSLYNLRNPAVKRLMKEAEELLHPTDEYYAQPLEDNLFEWHFTLRGPPNTDYEGGIYHGRITLPPDYPMKPPSIILLTPNGRFETNKKICLSISGHHPESWQPSWSIRTALLAIIGFMPTHGGGALGSLDYTPEERLQLAIKSQTFKCSECGCVKDIFLKKKSECSTEHKLQEPSDEFTHLELTNEYSHQEPLVKDSNEECLVKDSNEECLVKDSHEESLVKDSHEESLVKDSHEEPSFLFEPDDDNTLSTELRKTHVYLESMKVDSKTDEASLVRRVKSSPGQAVNPELRVATSTNDQLLYSVFISVIVAIIMFLCIRRLFSL